MQLHHRRQTSLTRRSSTQATDDLRQQADEIRKKIVATKEGGAITGEERIREKTTQLYGAIVLLRGPARRLLVERIDSLTHERNDLAGEFDALAASAQKLAAIYSISREEWDRSEQSR